MIAEYDRLEAQLRELDDRNASAIGAWIASGREGPAPDDSDAKSLTATMVALRPELAAARRTLPEKEAQHGAAIKRLGAAVADREVALDEVAILAANAVAGELTEALQAITIEAKLIGLHNALLERARHQQQRRPCRRETLRDDPGGKAKCGRAAQCRERPAAARRAGERSGSDVVMMGVVGQAAPSAATSEMSILRALARLLDPEAGPGEK